MSIPVQVQQILDEARETPEGQFHLGTSVPVTSCPVLKTVTQLESLGYKFKHHKTNCFGEQLFTCEELDAIYEIDHN